MIIPELDLELAGGTLGGMVTTVEGLVTQIRESECALQNLYIPFKISTLSFILVIIILSDLSTLEHIY